MGVKERREREKQELRERILAAARAIAAQEGWQALTIRKVAEIIEYSPPTIYDYFESKDAILQELARMGFALLLARLRAAVASTADPVERMVRLDLAYCAFAWDQPELYQVMHGLGGADCAIRTPPGELQSMGDVFMDTIHGALRAGGADQSDIYDAVQIHWATMHGLVALAMEGLVEGGRARATRLVTQATYAWLAAQRGARHG